MAAVARRKSGRRGTAVREDGPPADHLDLRVSAGGVDCFADRCVEARTMRPIRLTDAHQSITFSRRMLLLSGAEAAIATLLVGRMGYLAIAQNAKYQLL